MWDRDHSISWLEVSIRICLIIIIFGVVIVAQLYWKDENKEKETENGPFLKKNAIDIHFGADSSRGISLVEDTFCLRTFS